MSAGVCNSTARLTATSRYHVFPEVWLEFISGTCIPSFLKVFFFFAPVIHVFFFSLSYPSFALQIATIVLQRAGPNEIFDLCVSLCVSVTSFYVRVGLKTKVLLPVSSS
jgi:hypothetical protein